MPSHPAHNQVDWADQPIAIEVIEVPLTGPGDGHQAETGPPGPNWRRAIGVAVAFGSALGIVAGIVLANSDDEPDETGGAATTLPADELSTLITTPPTLQSLDTLPSAELTPTTDPGVATAPTQASGDPAVLERAPLPQYPGIQPGFPGIQPGDELQFSLTEAVARLAERRAYRSVTSVDHPDLGFEMTATNQYDPVSNRYQLDITFDGANARWIIDVATDLAYFVQEDGSAEATAAQVLLDGVEAESITQLFDALLFGPIRPDTFGSASTTGRGLYYSTEFGPLRQFGVAIDAELLPEWFPYIVGPGRPGLVGDVEVVEYLVYVDRNGDLRQVDGVADVGGSAERISHALTVLDDSPSIELPELIDAPEPTPTIDVSG